ncbi:hypothetical protein CRG98_024642 [Punica granatum]|uniref:Uncharacterized protein n=1 Tax=Punica granatum TaxID=22663 RepID=A0A2I0JGE0_PUNGR|nr:hypothetical protein CRG98_024642 [Punica granatum]
MKALLVQHGLEGVLEGKNKPLAILSPEMRKTVMSKAIVMDLANADVKIEEEDHALLLLCFPMEAYESFVNIILYGSTSITLEDVKVALNSKELQKKVIEYHGSNGQGLISRGRSI